MFALKHARFIRTTWTAHDTRPPPGHGASDMASSAIHAVTQSKPNRHNALQHISPLLVETAVTEKSPRGVMCIVETTQQNTSWRRHWPLIVSGKDVAVHMHSDHPGDDGRRSTICVAQEKGRWSHLPRLLKDDGKGCSRKNQKHLSLTVVPTIWTLNFQIDKTFDVESYLHKKKKTKARKAAVNEILAAVCNNDDFKVLARLPCC